MNPLIEATRAIILAAAMAHGVDPQVMDHVAQCESGYNRFAVNGPFMGVFQLGTAKRKQFAAQGYDDVFDPSQQANFVADLIANGEINDWAGCAR
jgi:hypothetical protein